MTVVYVKDDPESQSAEAYAAHAYRQLELGVFDEAQTKVLRELVRAFSGFVPAGYHVTNPGRHNETHYPDYPEEGAYNAAYEKAPEVVVLPNQVVGAGAPPDYKGPGKPKGQPKDVRPLDAPAVVSAAEYQRNLPQDYDTMTGNPRQPDDVRPFTSGSDPDGSPVFFPPADHRLNADSADPDAAQVYTETTDGVTPTVYQHPTPTTVEETTRQRRAREQREQRDQNTGGNV